MYVFRRVSDLQAYLRKQQVNNRTVGFIPTMGALHNGHLALIRTSLAANQVTVCSIFVNPTQFNDAKDLEKYPRLPSKDLSLLAKVGCQVVFLPTVAEVYPPEGLDMPTVDLGGLEFPMEGAKRPGHFAGVVQVVARLLDIVKANYLYMGQKDYQQQAIIRRMITVLQLPVQLKTVATQREADGLAMSSRNVLLSSEHRAQAPQLYETLKWVAESLAENKTPDGLEQQALARLTTDYLQAEYFSIVDGHTLQTVSDSNAHDLIVACTAVWAGEVRLIDNMIIKGQL